MLLFGSIEGDWLCISDALQNPLYILMITYMVPECFCRLPTEPVAGVLTPRTARWHVGPFLRHRTWQSSHT